MPPKINLEPYKDEILTWVEDGLLYDQVLSKISDVLGIQYSYASLKRLFTSWNISRNRKNGSPEVERIKSRIVAFFLDNYNDSMILQALSTEGIQMSRRQLRRYRLELKLVRRMSIEERLQKIRELKNIVREELDKGHIEGYGEGLIKTYFRGLGITVSRSMIY